MQIQLPAQNGATVPRGRPQTRVSVKRKWADGWQTIGYLQPLRASDSAAPTIPKATFRWLSGSIKREDASAYAAVPRILLADYYVKIEVIPATGGATQYPLFVGRFYEDSMLVNGSAQGPSADQELTAFGLQHELDRETVRGAFVTDDGAASYQVRTNLTFNEQYVRGYRELGNRSQNLTNAVITFLDGSSASAHTYAFANDRDAGGNPVPWSVLDIVGYLLNCYGPPEFQFTVGGQTNAIAGLVFPRVAVHHQSVYQLLNELIDRRLGLGWRLRTTGQGRVEVQIFTVFDERVSFGGATVSPNADTNNLDVSGHLPGRVTIDTDSHTRYGTIIVAGEPILSCFTVSFKDNTLEKGWTDQKETDYKAGGGAADQRTADQNRATPAFHHVYTTFKIPRNWGWKAGDGQGGAGGVGGLHNANPNPDVFGKLPTVGAAKGAPVRKWGHTLLRSLPLLKDDANRSDPDGLEPEYLEPFVLLYDEASKRYVYAHDPGDPEQSAGAHVRMLDRDFGFQVHHTPNHTLALNQFTPGAGGTAPSSHPPKYDYTKIIATVAARTDERLEVIAQVAGVDKTRVLQIYVEDAETWYLVPGTILSVDNGKPYSQPLTGGVNSHGVGGVGALLRDDSPRLRQIAAAALAWFGKPRSTLTLTVQDLWAQYRPGSYINQVADGVRTETVNSVVSHVHWDLEAMATTLQTQFAELDFREAGGRASHPTLR